jgi:hypothetical protein
MNEWKHHLTPEEAALLTEWETDEKRHRDHAALYAVWRRRLADKVRARMKREMA